MKILVIDDDELILKAIRHCLKANQWEVISVQNSIQALEAIEVERPDLILCDILMPGFSGLELLSLLKNFYLNTIPIIIISSLKTTELVLSAKKMGAADYLFKPLNFKNLVKRIRQIKELA